MARVLLLNRFTGTFGAIAVAVVLWNAYVALNDDGIVAGRVVDAQGQPVAGAQVAVTTNEINNLSADPVTATTGPDGRFRMEGVPFFNFNIQAEKPGTGRSASVNHHLYFRSQNITLPQPLVVRPDEA